MANPKTITVGETPETPVVPTPEPAQTKTKPVTQAYKCVHPRGLEFNGQTYKSAQRYVFSEAELYEGGWLDSQIKAKLFEPVE